MDHTYTNSMEISMQIANAMHSVDSIISFVRLTNYDVV